MLFRSQYQHSDYDVIEFPGGYAGNGFAAVYILFFFQALRREFKGPGEKYGERETNSKKEQEDMEYPARGGNVIQNDISDLQYQPRHNDVGKTHTEHISAFEFVE